MFEKEYLPFDIFVFDWFCSEFFVFESSLHFFQHNFKTMATSRIHNKNSSQSFLIYE